MYVHAEPSAARLLACPAKKQRAEPPSKLIPAGAGNTTFFSSWSGLGAVHPRWRGEHFLQFGSQILCNGSSPLARGTLRPHGCEQRFRRFIPAGAGNTSRCRNGTQPGAVHPRWRGEHEVACTVVVPVAGSSPLARGTLRMGGEVMLKWRFIPAGAGNTRWQPSAQRVRTVHPRWRGEHPELPCSPIPAGGSSPLARGTRFHGIGHVQQLRFIPAGAGNTF